MSNLFKRSNVIKQDERIIDYNEVIKTKIEGLLTAASKSKAGADGFISGLDAEVVQTLLNPEDAGSTDMPVESQMIARADLETANLNAENIVSGANEEAEAILSNANAEAALIKEKAQNDGMEKGLSDATAEIEKQKAELQQEYEQKQMKLQQEYDEMKASMEPELVSVITDVFRNVIHAVSEDNEEMILNLVNSVMHNSEASKEFVIKVSPDDYRFLINNQGKIYCAMSKDVQIEIIEDSSMKKNQCIIESELGVYDCSLDIQLENIIRNIKLLSCI